jgi:hypothetical protein
MVLDRVMSTAAAARRHRRVASLLAATLLLPTSGALAVPAAAAPAGVDRTAPVAVAAPTDRLPQLRIAAAKRDSSVSAFVSDDRPRKGETIWVSGRLVIGGSGASGRQVVVQARGRGTTTWSKIATLRTSSTGRYSLRLRPGLSREYRTIFRATDTVAGSRSVVRQAFLVRKARTNASRAEVMGSKIGTPQTRLRRVSSSVAYRSFSSGMLVTVSRTTTRTWWVQGGILQEYLRRGGPGGSLGVPRQDARCRLLWGGCVQRFSKGVVYVNSQGGRAVTSVKGRKGEVIAAARSQVGYTVRRQYDSSRYVYHSKFNDWKNSTSPWCGIFQSWAFAASGNGGLVPQSKYWVRYRDTVRRTLPLGSTPRVGALAFVSYVASGEPSHTMLVVDKRPGEIRVIHGNTTGAGTLPRGTRGVLEQWVRESQVLYYAYPRY